MHSAAWQAVCGFLTDVYESLEREDVSMRYIFEMICRNDSAPYALWMENGKKQRYTFAEFRDRCAAAACRLDETVPQKDGIVALHLYNSPIWPVLFWAILMSGRVPLLLNAQLPLAQYRQLLENVQAAAVISQESAQGAIAPSGLVQHNVGSDIAMFEQRWADRVIFMTSGTSGAPKLLVYNGSRLAKQIQSCRYFYRETTELVYPKSLGALRQLALLPFSHIFGFIVCVLWYPCFGKQVVYPRSIRPDDVLAACQQLHVTHFCAVPSYFDILVQVMIRAAKKLFGKYAEGLIAYLRDGCLPQPEVYQRYQQYARRLRDKVLGPGIRYMISGGGALSPATAAFLNRMQLYFCNGYGMTELGILAVERSDLPEKRMQASIGYPSWGVSFDLRDSQELWVECDFAALGYLENGGLVPLEKPFPTQDMARRMSDGRFVLLGRSDDIFIDGDGNRVHPKEIEERLPLVEGITAVSVIRVDQKMVALLEGPNGADVKMLSQVINRTNEISPISQCIHEAWLCEKLERTAKGEVNRVKMAGLYRSGLEHACLIPQIKSCTEEELNLSMMNEIRRKVAQLLSLDEEQVLPNSHFFSELGMDSLSYMCFVQWLEEKYRLPAWSQEGRRFDSVTQCVAYIQNKGGCES